MRPKRRAAVLMLLLGCAWRVEAAEIVPAFDIYAKPGRLVTIEAGADERQAAHDRNCDQALRAGRLSVEAAVAQQCIDSAPAEFSSSTRAVIQAQRLSPRMAQAAASERDSFATISEAELVGATRTLGAIPMLVLTAGADFEGLPEEAALLAELRRHHASLARLSTRGEERVVPGAGHIIQSSAPDAVIEAVLDVLQQEGSAN